MVGCGRVGSELATILSRDGNEVSVIDKNPEALHRLAMDWGARESSASALTATPSKRQG